MKKALDFTIAICGIGLIMGALGASGNFSFPALMTFGIGFGLVVGGIFRAIEKRDRANEC